MTKIAVIGECMIEMLQQPDGLYSAGHAGDTFNMAQYLAWLSADDDIQVSYVTALGRDAFGRDMLKNWEENNIDTSFVMTIEDKNTGLYFANTDENGNRDYVFFRSDSAARLIFKQRHSEALFDKIVNDFDMIYTSAISLMILRGEDRDKLVDLFIRARKNGVKTAFDTNYRAAGWNSKKDAAYWIKKIMAHTDIALPTDDENRELFNDYVPQDTIDRVKSYGVNEIVVKCGGEKCVSYHDEQQIDIPAEQGIKVLDTTSAGDSFNAGYLYGRLKGLVPEKAAKWGHKLAATVIQHRGALIPTSELPEFDVDK